MRIIPIYNELMSVVYSFKLCSSTLLLYFWAVFERFGFSIPAKVLELVKGTVPAIPRGELKVFFLRGLGLNSKDFL